MPDSGQIVENLDKIAANGLALGFLARICGRHSSGAALRLAAR